MSGIKEAKFDELMRQFQDCASVETVWAMQILGINCDTFHKLIIRRASVGASVGLLDFKESMCITPAFGDDAEVQFGKLCENANWINFVNGVRNWVSQQPQQPQMQQPQMQQMQQMQQPQMQQPQMQQMQQMQQPQMQQQQMQQQQMQQENWNRIRNKLLMCDETTQHLATQLGLDAFGGCDMLLSILKYRGDAFPRSLFAEPLDVAAENRFVDEVNTGGLTLEHAKWIQFIEYLRYSIRSQQPTASHAEQYASRAAEESAPEPPHRGLPIKSNVYGIYSQDEMQPRLVSVLKNIFTDGGDVKGDSWCAIDCDGLIRQVLDKPPSFTQKQLNEMSGVDATAMLPVPVLQTTFHNAYPNLDFDSAYGYACMAYLKCNSFYRNKVEKECIPSELREFVDQFNDFEHQGVYRMWTRFFMIAQLMYSWTQIGHYDRSGVYDGGKSSKRSNSKRSNFKRSNSKCSKRSNSKRSNSKRSNSKRSNSKRSNCRSTRR
jgi:hypothetical protein